MTIQEEAEYINRLLPEIAKHPGGFNIRLLATPPVTREHHQELKGLARRLATEELAIPSNPDSIYSLVITPKGKQVVEGSNGYLGHLERLAKQERKAGWQALLTVWSTVISAAAAVVAIGISLWLDSSLDATNAQVEAQAKRIRALEVQLIELSK